MPLQSRTVVCHENRHLADWFFRKQQELDIAEVRQPKAEETLKRAFVKVCDHPTFIQNLQDAKKVKGIGPWLLKKMNEEFFPDDGSTHDPPVSPGPARGEGGRKERPKKRYLPGKNTAGYAILITLLRAHQAGKEFMRRQELIDATESSGLSRLPIMPGKSSIWSGPRSGRDFYCGWSNMNNLISKGLVIKASNPAKYMLTEEGKVTAQECIAKSGLDEENGQGHSSAIGDSRSGVSHAEEYSEGPDSENDQVPESYEDIRETIMPACRQDEAFRCQSSHNFFSNPNAGSTTFSRNTTLAEAVVLTSRIHVSLCNGVYPATMGKDSSARAVARNDEQCSGPPPLNVAQANASCGLPGADSGNQLTIPPLKVGESFSDVYDVVCIVDRREQFRRGCSGNHLQRFVERLETQFQMKVETRQVPVGDAIWIARHKETAEEYVLDFVIERKAVDDLWMSIKDHRYKNQKLRLLKSGLKRLIYLVEGDVNMIDSTGACKTAMLSTELADGFHVIRTTDTNDTCKQYGYLTSAIKNRYQLESGECGRDSGSPCRTYPEFVEHCRDLDRDRVTDIFCLQLMQINHVTEDIALSIQDRYPTVYSLVQAYTTLEGHVGAQEKLLQGIPIRSSSKCISAVLSKSVYKLIWAP